MAANLPETNHDILVVEDEQEIRELITLHLFRKGVAFEGFTRLCIVAECPNIATHMNRLDRLFVPQMGDVLIFVNFGPLRV